jgi:thioester reductase-like protein
MTRPSGQTATARDVPDEYRFPLSYQQVRFWFLEQLTPGDPAYHMPIALRLHGALDVAALDAAFQVIVDRHEMLRTGFTADAGEPAQAVSASLSLPLIVADLSSVAQPERLLGDMAAKVICRPFDLSRAPLLRAVIARLGPVEHVLIVAVHHIICDGWSVGVLASELSAAYAACRAGGEPALAELPVQYGDFAVWQRDWLSGESLGAVLAHWEGTLTGAPAVLDLPTDHSRMLTTGHRGGHIRTAVGGELAARVDELAREHGVSLFMALLTAYAIVLGSSAGQDDMVIGTPAAGRPRPELRPLIGCFIDMLPIRVDLSGHPTVAELLDRVRAVCLDAYGHQDVPFERLVEHLQPERDMPRTPVFQVMLALQDTPAGVLHLPGLRTEEVHLDQGAAKYELTLNAERSGPDLLLDLEYNSDLFDPDSAGHLLRQVVNVLEWLSLGSPGRPALAGMTSTAEREWLARVGFRTDHQLKIRGYRVEPAEIEAALTRHPAVAECVVTAPHGGLTAYVVAGDATPATPDDLRRHLRATLPDYMLPAAFITLRHLPLTPNGTIDRTALADIALAESQPAPAQAEPVAPGDAHETAVLRCFRRVLGKPALGMADDFFDHGGSSLQAVRLVAEIERELGSAPRLRELFRAPTARGAVASLRGGGRKISAAPPEEDGRLAADITPAASCSTAWDPAHVMLTGGTGFLGLALLEQLLAAPGARITCLIRAAGDEAATARLRRAASRSGLDLGGRVTVIAGDVTAVHLGLSPRRYAALAEDVGAIYHCAANVSFAAPYAALRAANVTGTAELIRFAATSTGKALHYVSTLDLAAAGGQAVRERPYPLTPSESSGYVTSKRVGEMLVAEAARRGLPVTILRPWLVTAHRQSGAMGESDQLALELRAALLTGMLPDLPDLPIHVMPVDEVAAVMVRLGRRPAAAGRIVHLHNPRLARLGDVADLLDQIGHGVRRVPLAQWAEAVAGSGLPAGARLLARLFAESPARRLPPVEATAAESLLGYPVEFSGLSAAYLERAVTHVLSSTQ